MVCEPKRVLCVFQGAGGGIGRVELLLENALKCLEARLNLHVEILWKREPPSYLGADHSSDHWTASGDRYKFAQRILLHWLHTKPALVLFSHLNFSPLGLLMKTVRPRTAVVTIAHGIEAWGKLTPARSLALKSGQTIWSVSAYTRDLLVRESRIPANRIQVLPNALLAGQASRLREESGRSIRDSDSGPSILTVSRLDASERSKGVDHVLEAMPRVLDCIPNATHTVIGSGNDVGRLQSITRRLGIDKHVRFVGPASDAALTKAYGSCDLFALPSAKEGFGLVYLEAMAAGKPVVAARAGGTSEVVVDGMTGLLVDYGDVAALTNALVRLLSNRRLRADMGDAGRTRVEDEFSFDRYVARLSELLGQLTRPGASETRASDGEHRVAHSVVDRKIGARKALSERKGVNSHSGDKDYSD
jgi:phosphatidyl-myo-inositol dimannoside synthase